MKKTLSACGLGLMLMCNQAFAWVAMAASEDGYTHVTYDSETPEQAIAGAMKSCQKQSTGCKSSKAFNQMAFVLAKGTDGRWAYSADPDPMKARANALKSCSEIASGCKVATAVWDSGVVWGAVAIGGDATHLRVNALSKQEAEADALSGCKKLAADPDSCEVKTEMTTQQRAYFARARSKTALGYGLSAEAEEAKNIALKGCSGHIKDGERCSVDAVQLNNSNAPAPKTMVSVVAEAERNRKASVAKPSRTPPRTAPAAPRTAHPSPPRCINPATGLPMVATDGSCGGVDVGGNLYGMKN